MESRRTRRRGIGSRTAAVLFKLLTFWISPFARLDSRRKQKRLLRDVIEEMQWTMSNLRPRVESRGELAMGRYAAVTLRCPNYLLYVTGDFYGAAYDFWADVGSLSQPHQRVRIDTFAKQIGSLSSPTESSVHSAMPATLSDLDSLIRRLDPQLTAHFSRNVSGN